MSTDRDTTRIVRSWLRTEENESADRVLGTVLNRLDAIPQRQATSARRFTHMSYMLRFGAVATIVATAVVIGSQILSGPPRVGPQPTPSDPTASVAIPTPYPMPDEFATLPISLDRGVVETRLEIELPTDGSLVFGPDENAPWRYSASESGPDPYIGSWGMVIADITDATNHVSRWEQEAIGGDDAAGFLAGLAATGDYQLSPPRDAEVAGRPALVAEIVDAGAGEPGPSGESTGRAAHIDVEGASAIGFGGATRAYVVSLGERIIIIHFWSETAEGLELHRQLEDRIVRSIRLPDQALTGD